MKPEILLAYETGRLKGYIPDPRADAELATFLRNNGGYADAGDAIDDYRLKDSGAGKLSLPYLAALKFYPDCLPGGFQKRGSCVAWTSRNAALVSYCSYVAYGQNSERFTLPVVSPQAMANGVASTEGIYWFRRHGGDGWQCSSAAQVLISECGLLLRQNYPELGFDLTQYDVQLEGKWGLTSPPEKVAEACRQHLCSNATVCKTYEQARDMLANGYALSTCGQEAFVDQRDAYGACERDRRNSWAHAMAAIAVDDRAETVERYGCGLLLIQNSWPASYLKGPDVVMGTKFRIPPASFWARWSDLKDRYIVAIGPSKGWPANNLPDWGLSDIV
jgi:hypothetical protein